MVPNNQNALQLVLEIQQKNLLVALVQQLNKDFMSVGIDFDLPKDSTPEKIVTSLQFSLLDLIKKDFNRYVNLLYRIDIPEKQLKEIHEVEIEIISKKVTIIILRKEWQKVFFKSKNL